jgi:hypothetical protein
LSETTAVAIHAQGGEAHALTANVGEVADKDKLLAPQRQTCGLVDVFSTLPRTLRS